MWQNFIWNALELYARSLRMVAWKEGEEKVGILVGSFWTYEETISTLLRACVSSMERMTKNFQYLEKEIGEVQTKFKDKIKRKFSLPQQHRPESLLLRVGCS